MQTALNILIGLQILFAGAMLGILALRFFLPAEKRNQILTTCYRVLPDRVLPHHH